MPADSTFDQVAYLARYPDLRINGWMYKSADGSWKYGNPSNRETKNLSQPANTFWHWQNFGLAEGRVCGADLPGTVYSATFSPAAYLARYPDVRGTSILNSSWASNPEGHYRQIGLAQGRHPGYEIIYSNSPQGMTSPGTTTFAPDPVEITPGAGDLITTPPVTSTTTSTSSTDITAWVTANPMIILAAGAALLLLLSKPKHKIHR